MKSLFLLSVGIALLFAVSARGEDRINPPVPVRTSAPVFPEDLRRSGVSGLVLVSCLIDAEGEVRDMRVEKASNQEFVRPAIAALAKWKFKPAERDGTHVPVRVKIPIKFTADE